MKCVGPKPKFNKENNHLYEVDVLLNYANLNYGNTFHKFMEVGRIRERIVYNIEYIFFDVKSQKGRIIYNINILKSYYLKIEKSNRRYLKIKEILGDI